MSPETVAPPDEKRETEDALLRSRWVRGVQAIGGIVASVGGLFGGIIVVLDTAKAIRTRLPANPWLAGALCLGVAVAGFLAIRHSRRPVQLRIQSSDALRVDPRERRFLKGRSIDIESLAGAVRRNVLLFLTGESGVGKTALLASGLCESLANDDALLPIYCSDWGGDWDLGPRERVVEALWRSIGTERWNAEPPAGAQLLHLVRSVKEHLDRTPLLILDQFDDYETRHTEKLFLHDEFSSQGTRGNVRISPKVLVQRNSFWRDLKVLLDDGDLHCVVAVRADSADALQSLRLVEEPAAYKLHRPDSAGQFVEDVLGEVESAFTTETLNDQRSTWPALKRALANDLLAGAPIAGELSSVLPAQLAMVVESLPYLRPLDEEHYIAGGRLRGLETARVRQLTSTATQARWAPALRAGLAVLVRDDRPPKSLSLPRAEVARAIRASAWGSAAPSVDGGIESALEYLVRHRIVESAAGGDSLRLYHDFMCRAVLEAHRADDKTLFELREHFTAHQSARGRVEWFFTLLSPRLQAVFFLRRAGTLLPWVRRRMAPFRFGSYRQYVTTSLVVRSVPAAIASTALAFFAYENHVQDATQQKVANLKKALTPKGDSPSAGQVSALWSLATSPERDRLIFLRDLVADTDLRDRIGPSMAAVLQAASGMTLEERSRAYAVVMAPCSASAAFDPHTSIWCLSAAASIGFRSPQYTKLVVAALDWAAVHSDSHDRVDVESALSNAQETGLIAPQECVSILAHVVNIVATATDAAGLDAVLDASPRCFLPAKDLASARNHLVELGRAGKPHAMAPLMALRDRVEGPAPPWFRELVESEVGSCRDASWVASGLTETYGLHQDLRFHRDVGDDELSETVQWLALFIAGHEDKNRALLPQLVPALVRRARLQPKLMRQILGAAIGAADESVARSYWIGLLKNFDDKVTAPDASRLVSALVEANAPPIYDSDDLTTVLHHLDDASLPSAVEVVIKQLERMATRARPRAAPRLEEVIHTELADTSGGLSGGLFEGYDTVALASAIEGARLPAPQLARFAHVVREWVLRYHSRLDLAIIKDVIAAMPCARTEKSGPLDWLCQNFPRDPADKDAAVTRPGSPTASIATVLDEIETDISSGHKNGAALIARIQAASGRATAERGVRAIRAATEALLDGRLVDTDPRYVYDGSLLYVPFGESRSLRDVLNPPPPGGLSLLRAVAEQSQMPTLDAAAEILLGDVTRRVMAPERQRGAWELFALDSDRTVHTTVADRWFDWAVDRVMKDADELRFADALLLRAVARLTTSGFAGSASKRLVDEAQCTQDPARFGILVAALDEVGLPLEPPIALNLLAWPTCVTDCRAALMKLTRGAPVVLAETLDDVLRRLQSAPGVVLESYPRLAASTSGCDQGQEAALQGSKR